MTRLTVHTLLLATAACAAGHGCAPSAVPPPRAGEAGEKYVFVPDTDRLVEIVRGDLVLTGKLDINGDFLEDPHHRRKTNMPVYSQPSIVLLNANQGPAYEYRSGQLIKGVIADWGNFVPEIGSAVVPFTDYRYGPDALPIWNLPGRFVKKSDLKKQ